MRAGLPDSSLIDEALAALAARHRAGEIDAAYAAAGHQPAIWPADDAVTEATR